MHFITFFKFFLPQVVDFKVDYEFNGRKYATIKKDGNHRIGSNSIKKYKLIGKLLI